MNTLKSRKYTSPLRDAHTKDTRERILKAVATLLKESADGNVSMDAVARTARIERRTVFRHFATKEVLLDAFWDWINARLAPKTLPETLDDLIEAPKQTFRRFDEEEGLIRASLHTAAGREMRLRTVAGRRQAFHRSLRDVTRDLGEKDAARLEAVAHLLYSAAAWELLRDYCGLSGDDAGETVSWALDLIVRASGRNLDNERPSDTVSRKGEAS